MVIYKPNFDFEEFQDGMNQYITNLENNREDWFFWNWTRKAVFHYLLDYFEHKGIETTQISSVYKVDGGRLFDEANYKFIVGLSMRVYENALNFVLEPEYITIYERALKSFLLEEISFSEFQKVSLGAS